MTSSCGRKYCRDCTTVGFLPSWSVTVSRTGTVSTGPRTTWSFDHFSITSARADSAVVLRSSINPMIISLGISRTKKTIPINTIFSISCQLIMDDLSGPLFPGPAGS